MSPSPDSHDWQRHDTIELTDVILIGGLGGIVAPLIYDYASRGTWMGAGVLLFLSVYILALVLKFRRAK